MVRMINFLFFAQKVSSGSGALRPKFLGGYSGTRNPPPPKKKKKKKKKMGAKGVQRGSKFVLFHCLFSLFSIIYSSNTYVAIFQFY